MKWIFALSFLFLASSCGPSEKRDTDFSSKDSNSSSNTNCPLTYSPIPLLREGMQSIASPDLLPKGRYELTLGEYFLREETGEEPFKSHFLEEIRAGGILSKKVCADKISSEILFDTSFSGFKQIIKSDSNSTYLAFNALIQGQEENIRFSKSQSTLINGSVLSVLQDWDQWKIYQNNANSFEFRFSSFDIEGGFGYRKTMLLRFQYFKE
jgi:hypothetical protein